MEGMRPEAVGRLGGCAGEGTAEEQDKFCIEANGRLDQASREEEEEEDEELECSGGGAGVHMDAMALWTANQATGAQALSL